MTKISNDTVYIVDTDVSDLDSLIGTDGNTTAKRTKNFLLGKLKSYFISGLSPLTGGTLRFTEITYSGESYTTHAEVLNDLDPVFVIDQYHVVVVNLNGAKSILKLQNQSVGIDLPLVIDTDFITLPTAVGPAGKSVVSITKTNTVGLVDTYTILFSDAATTTFTVTNGSNGANGSNGTNGTNGATGNGIATVIKTSTVGLVDTYTITFTNASTTTFTVTNGANGTNGTNGTNGNDYTANLQKTITYPDDFAGANYTLTNADNNYEIIIDNGANAVFIIVPSGLTSKIGFGFTQKGTADVGYVASGTTINTPIGLKIKGQNYQTFLSQESATNNYFLGGNTKA